MVIGTFPVALGRNPIGHKQQQGDSRTPEGRYILDFRKVNSQFYRALHVSYPNAQDIIEASRRGVEPGGDIMVHGLPNWYRGDDRFFSFGDWTNGCIALGNRNMDVLWQTVPEGTPIDILP
jgi:murein L,D-transpeptidase YafK